MSNTHAALLEAARAALDTLDRYEAEAPAADALRAAIAQAEGAPMCQCKDRPASQCPGEWEPGCDLGSNPKFARIYEPAEAAK